MPDEDPILRVLAAEFAIHRGRTQHRPTYDTGRKGHDGAGADVDPRPRKVSEFGVPTNTFVAEWTDEGVVVTFPEAT